MADGWRALPEMVGKALAAGTPARYPLVPARAHDGFALDWRHLARPADPDGAVRVGSGPAAYVHPVATSFTLIATAQRARLEGPDEATGERIAAGLASLLAAQSEDGSFRYPVAVPRYGLAAGWSSALAQGLFVAAVADSRHLAPDSQRERALDASRRAGEHLLLAVEEGGCTTHDELGPFYEECPSSNPPYILNGAAIAVLGLAASPVGEHTDAAGAAAESLAQRLGSWDLGYWSRYDLLDRTPASPDYHALHVALLRALHLRFPDLGFASWAERFAGQAGARHHRVRALASISGRRLVDLTRGRR